MNDDNNNNPYAPPKSRFDPLPSDMSFWNPTVACWLSLFFSPTFGAIIQMLNWKALGQTKQVNNSKIWIVGTVLYYVLALIFDPLSDSMLTLLTEFLVFFGWLLGPGLKQVEYFKQNIGKHAYRRKSWISPILLAILIWGSIYYILYINNML